MTTTSSKYVTLLCEAKAKTGQEAAMKSFIAEPGHRIAPRRGQHRIRGS